MNREEFLELSQKNWDEAARLYSALRAERDELKEMTAKAAVTMPDECMAEAAHWVVHRIDDLTKFLAECCLERAALRAKNKALAQQFLDADGYVVELRARCAELMELGDAMSSDITVPLTGAMMAWRRAVRG